jgi:hypothetical protein
MLPAGAIAVLNCSLCEAGTYQTGSGQDLHQTSIITSAFAELLSQESVKSYAKCFRSHKKLGILKSHSNTIQEPKSRICAVLHTIWLSSMQGQQ